MLLGAFRFIVAGFIMLLYSLLIRERIFKSKIIWHASITGTLLLFGGTGAVIWVEQVLPSALVAILVSAAPFWFILLDKPMWKVSFRNKSTVIGLIAGFAGILFLFSEKLTSIFNGSVNSELGSMLLILLGSLCWTAGSIYSKYKSPSGSNTVTVGWQMLAAGLPFLLLSILNGELQNMNWTTIPVKAWIAIWYLILFGSIAAFTAYVWLLKVRPSAQVSTYAYVNPVVAVLLGVVFASEKVSPKQLIGLAIILTSVMLINLAKYKKKSQPKQL